MTRPSLAPALLAVVLLAALASPAGAATRGTFSIDPAVVGQTGRPPAALPATRVSNTTPYALRVTVTPAPMTEALNGSFLYSSEARGLFDAQRTFSATPRSFVLQRGETRVVQPRWVNLRRGGRAAYVTLVFHGTPLGVAADQIKQRYELAALYYLTLPGARDYRGEITGIRGEQFGPRRLRFFTRVRNRGKTHGRPRRTSLTIRDAAGRVVFRRGWKNGLVIPGASVDFPVVVTKSLPAGSYTAAAAMTFGGGRRRATRSFGFKLVGANRLPTVRAHLDGVNASGVIGKQAAVTATVRNTGTAAAAPSLRVRLFRLTGSGDRRTLVATKTSDVGRLAVGDRRTLSLKLGSVEQQRYRVLVDMRVPGGQPDELTADFAGRKADPFARRLNHWVSDHALALIALLVIAAAGAGAFGAAALTRRRVS